MILYDKIKAKYSKEEIKELLGISIGGRIIRNEINVNPSSISSKINLLELCYTMEDFFIDYKEITDKYIEKNMYYNLFLRGLTINYIKNKFDLETQIYAYLIRGFDYNGFTRNMHLAFDSLGIVVDTSPFTVDLYKTHVELFGKKEDLENFRNRYGIKWELWYEPYRKSWHLAFNGCLAEYIRTKKAG
ncbi:hypothetical protein [Psychrilyobacter atlanticus]|uniref:hypothetical protein n=1 Tax=Psychrilyobacter atlanticus TaxID=271091 RepID=UPI000422B581|nr:hypothetical protein [Psychrilyobacter atlanticus]